MIFHLCISVNGHSFIEQDEQKDFNVKARSIVVHTSDNIIEHPDTIAYYQVRSRSPGHNERTLPSKNTENTFFGLLTKKLEPSSHFFYFFIKLQLHRYTQNPNFKKFS